MKQLELFPKRKSDRIDWLKMAVMWVLGGIFLGIVFWAMPANAEDNVVPIGAKGSGEVIVCDTAEQLASILDANFDGGFEAGKMAYLLLYMTKNDLNSPACHVGRYQFFFVETIGEPYENLELRLQGGWIFPKTYITKVVSHSGMTFYVTTSWIVVPQEEYDERKNARQTAT